jgi:hypothetical protein
MCLLYFASIISETNKEFISNTKIIHPKKMRKKIPAQTILLLLFLSSILARAQEQEGKNNFEDWGTKPPIVTPNMNNAPSSDAIVLFQDNFEKWITVSGKEITWPVHDHEFSLVTGGESIITRQGFGDCQLHIEWNIPTDEDHKKTLNWGNSGIYFMGLYEVQIYDSYLDKRKIYYNGQAGSIYKQHSPLVNCCKQPGEWQSFDIVFTAPVYNSDSTLQSPAFFTVFQNGILIQNHVSLIGPTTHGDYTEYIFHEPELPLLIQSHGSAVKFRNIWIREL